MNRFRAKESTETDLADRATIHDITDITAYTIGGP